MAIQLQSFSLFGSGSDANDAEDEGLYHKIPGSGRSATENSVDDLSSSTYNPRTSTAESDFIPNWYDRTHLIFFQR